MSNRSSRALPACLSALLLAAGCGSVGVESGVDFYLTVHLQTGFKTNVVDRLETVFQAAPTLVLAEVEGSDSNGGISWHTRDVGRGDEFVVDITGEYFRTAAVEVTRDTWEIDIPFRGGQSEGSFGLRASVYWEDPAGVEQEVGYGTAAELRLPVEDPATPRVIEVTCRDAFQYTCRTGCTTGSSPCDDRADCGSGTWACIDGCCVSQ